MRHLAKQRRRSLWLLMGENIWFNKLFQRGRVEDQVFSFSVIFVFIRVYILIFYIYSCRNVGRLLNI